MPIIIFMRMKKKTIKNKISSFGLNAELFDEMLPQVTLLDKNNFKSYHGYSKKINCPDDKYRQSLIMFYYSKKQIDNMEKRNGAYWKNKW